MSIDSKYRAYYEQLVKKAHSLADALDSRDERDNTLLHTLLLEETKAEKPEHRLFLADCIGDLVERGARVGAPNKEGTTPLMLALGRSALMPARTAAPH